ncbi:MAG: outer membrane protein transport protein [Myxococcota bacterium]
MRPRPVLVAFFILSCFSLRASPVHATNGHVLHGIGPANQALGGAGAAFATDVTSALHWNPATTGALDTNRIEISAEYFVPDRTLRGRVASGAFGPGVPATDLSGSTGSDVNAATLPSLAALYRVADSPVTWSVAVSALAGFGVEYDAENPPAPGSNPLVSSQPPGGLGLGKVKSDYQLVTISLGATYDIRPRVRIGVAAVTAVSRFKITPAAFAVPDDANGDTFFTYPGSNGFDEVVGGGFRVGVQIEPLDGLHLGLAYASPLWFDAFAWDPVDELGAPRDLDFRLDFPAQVNAGVSYRLTPALRVEADLRWIDYAGTRGFRRGGYAPNGAVRGFGWRSIFVVALGIEHRISDAATVRLGYNFGENPIPSTRTFYNLPAPAIVQHHLTAGVGVALTSFADLDVAYYHAFAESDHGRIVTPSGPVAGTEVRSELSENSVRVGLTFHFGR